jgi:hypothetical protein
MWFYFSWWQENVDITACNVTKSCFREPVQCLSGACRFVLTWTYNGNGKAVSFEMEAGVSSAESYVAFALSTDESMVSTLFASIPVDELLAHRRA